MASKAKNALINAFLDLVEEIEFEKITVTSLVEKCGISRQTFYYHFNDIEEMLDYAFKTETSFICKNQVEGNWLESAKMYEDFLSRYDRLIRSASKSPYFITVYNLIYNSFYTYISTYINNRSKKPAVSKEDGEFIISCLANSFAGLVAQEIQKDESDYASLLNKIAKGFKLIPNN